MLLGQRAILGVIAREWGLLLSELQCATAGREELHVLYHACTRRAARNRQLQCELRIAVQDERARGDGAGQGLRHARAASRKLGIQEDLSGNVHLCTGSGHQGE